MILGSSANKSNTGPKMSKFAQSASSQAATPQTSERASAEPEDAYASGRNERVLGTFGAGLGAITGRIGLLAASAKLGAVAGGAVLGPVGAVVGGIAGFGAGAFVEFRDKAFKGIKVMGQHLPLGRVVGGIIGGVVGSTVGKVLDKLSFGKLKLGSDKFNKESKDFSLPKLFKNVRNVNHTSMPTMNEAGKTKEIVSQLKAGDIIMTNSDLWMDFEIPLKLTGSKGDWTHTAVYDGKGKSIEALASRGVVERPVEELIGENHHVRVLRPKYGDGGAEKAIEYSRSKIGMPYDFKFSSSDDSYYCIELSHKALNEAAPQIPLKPRKLLWNVVGPEVYTPVSFNEAVKESEDLEIVYDTGSNFNSNYLAKFS